MTVIFDQALLDRRRRRAVRLATPGADFLLRTAAEDLADRLALVKRRFDVGIDLATPTGLLAEMLRATGQVERLFRLDRVGLAADIVADPEILPFTESSVDLVVSALALHWVNDLPGLFAQVRRALRPDGLLLVALPGGETLTELRLALTEAELELRGGAGLRVAPFGELRDLGALLQRAGLALPVADQDRLVVRYDSALDLMRDLRAMGATNVLAERDRRPLSRRMLLRAAEIYADRFADPDGRVRATFQIVSLSGWAPAPDQPQPLRPGSARMRLADALGVSESSAGEKAGPSRR
jgi:SAM-dependent methyltransferase